MVQYSNFSIDYKLSKGRIFNEKDDPNRTCFKLIPLGKSDSTLFTTELTDLPNDLLDIFIN